MSREEINRARTAGLLARLVSAGAGAGVRHTVKLPKLGDTADEVVIVQCYRLPGDAISRGEPIFRVETDKVEVDIESPVSGIVREVLAQDGDEVTTGSAIAVVEE